MAEYIEKEALLEEVESRIAWSLSYNAIFEAIQEAPASDVAPVVHGRWLAVEEEQWMAGLALVGYECSMCGNGEGHNNMNFCPSCRAKMEG